MKIGLKHFYFYFHTCRTSWAHKQTLEFQFSMTNNCFMFYLFIIIIMYLLFTIVLGLVNGCPWLTGFYWLSEVNLICDVFSSWPLCCWPAWLPCCHCGGSDVAGAHCHRGGGLPAGPQKEDRWLPVSVREAGQRSIRGHSHYKPKSVRLWSFSRAKGNFH